MTWVAGADGCKSGWLVTLRETDSCEIKVRVVAALSEALRFEERPAVVCVDIPIGLLDQAVPGGRECDKAARILLGQPRARSVFSPPARPTLRAATFEEAVRLNRATSHHASGISRQSFGILTKIREADKLMSPLLQERVLEVHPEVSFYELNDAAPLAEGKKSKIGLNLRIGRLEGAWKRELSQIIEAHRTSKVARDDIVDAMAACWTAERVLAGRAVRLPSEPPHDSRGLCMEIVR